MPFTVPLVTPPTRQGVAVTGKRAVGDPHDGPVELGIIDIR